MSRVLGRIFLAAIFLILAVTGGQTASGNQTMKLKDVALGKVVQVGSVKFVKVGANQYLALDLCPDGSTYSSYLKGCVVKTTTFDYIGGEQTFTAPSDGLYVLEVWGAQGGFVASTAQHADWTNKRGGYGAYSVGVIALGGQANIHLVIGGAGGDGTVASGSCSCGGGVGGYNGGGAGGRGSYYAGGGGGGATHVALDSGLLSSLSTHKNDGTILIVAAGGGGGNPHSSGGDGGGINGVTTTADTSCGYSGVTGGTQSSGYAFGQGATGGNKSGWLTCGTEGNGGGGGGWYGGTSYTVSASQSDAAGGGGSGYIGSSNLISTETLTKHMTCYNCETSTVEATYTISDTCASETPRADCAKIGNGAARITQLSVYLGI